MFRDGFEVTPLRIRSLHEYHPMYGGRFDEASGRILRVKDKEMAAVAYYQAELDRIVAPGVAVAVVPSSDPARRDSGIRRITEFVARREGRVDLTDCLVRTQRVPRASQGGRRDEDLHMRTIKVRNPESVTGVEVLLLDDVTTSHSSLWACKLLLEKAGVSLVQMMALARTTR